MKTYTGKKALNIKYIESKIAKNIGLLYKAKRYIGNHSLFAIVSFLHMITKSHRTCFM